MARIIIAPPNSGGPELEVDQDRFDAGFFRGYVWVRDATPQPSSEVSAEESRFAGLVSSGTVLPAALRAAYVPKWKASTAYASGEFVLNPSGQIVSANTAFTSGASYSSSNWTIVSGGASYTDEQAQDAVAAMFAAGTDTGITFVYDDAGNRIGATVSDTTKAPLLVPTAIKTAAYTVAAGELAMMNVAGGGITLTLPTAPADKSQVGYRAIGATAAVPLTINRGGTDTIGTAGATSTVIPLADEVAVLQYQAASTRWLAVANVKTQASLAVAVAADGTFKRTFARKLQFVSAYQSVPTGFGTNQASGISFQHTHKLTVAATDVRLVVPLGFSVAPSQTSTDVLGTAAIPFKGTLVLGGAVRPVLFGGGRQKSNDPGGILVSDPVSADAAAGTAVPVRAFFNVTTGQPYPNTIGTGQGPGFTASGDGFTSGSDVSDSLTAMTSQATTGFVPHGLIGVPATPQVAIGGVGDSIMLGTGDAANNGGFLADATNATVPFLRLAVGGASAQGWAAGHSYSWPLLDYCTHAIVLLGANDLNTTNGPRTLVQFQADMTTIYTALRNRGLKVYACTILPRTTSNANTTVASTAFAAGGSSVRGQANAWIRGGAGGLIDGFFETADAVESGRDTGFWASTSLTSDGAHPTAAGHTLMAAAINIGALTV